MNHLQAQNFLIEVLSEANAAETLEHFEREGLFPPQAFDVTQDHLRQMGVIDVDTRARILRAFAAAKVSGRKMPPSPSPYSVSFAAAPAPQAHAPAPAGTMSVVVRDVDMPFSSMITFMVKWSLASIPAMLILFFIGGMLMAIFGGLFASCVAALG